MPVYNVEEYLRRCVDSLLDQGDFKDYEIILVDDSSTDRSGDICDEYSKSFDLVKVVHKENGGASSARNMGLQIAKGDYIMFVDSDDYIKSDMLSSLVLYIDSRDLDILTFNFSYVYNSGEVKVNEVNTTFDSESVSGAQYLLNNLKNNAMLMTVWQGVYKASLIKDNKIFFREGFVHEDEDWVPRVFYQAQKVGCLEDNIYGYYLRDNSVSNVNYRKAALDLIEICKSLKEFSLDITDDELRKLLQNNIVTLVLSAFYKGRLIDHKQDVLNLVEQLYLDNHNEKKILLFKKSPTLYIMVNSTMKQISVVISKLFNLKNFFRKAVDYSTQQIRRNLRKHLICRRQQKKLRNHTFSIISSTCNGGVITSELGQQFRSPTINLWMKSGDFVKLISNFEHYMKLEIKEVENNFQSYPVGRLGDITINFMHYHTFDEAKDKWDQRKQRINYDNLFFMMAERDECTPDIIKQFDELPYKNKIIFTYNEYLEYESAICVKECSKDGEAAIMTDFVGLCGRKYDKYFDYVKWLNGEEI